MLLADYQAYIDCQERVSEAYRRSTRAGRACRSSTARASAASRRIARSGSTAATSGHHVTRREVGERQSTPRRRRSPLGHAGTTAPSRRASAPLGATVCGDGVNFSVFAKSRRSIELLLFDDAMPTQPARVIPLDAAPSQLPLLARVRAGARGRSALCLPRARPFARERGLRFDRDKVLLDPYGRAVAVPAVRPRRRRAGPATTPRPHEERRRGSRPLRLGRRPPLAGRSTRPSSTRCTCAASPGTRAPASRPAKRGTFAGLDREDSLPPGSRRHRGRAAAGLPVRSARRAARARELLGLPADFVLRAASRLQLAAGSAGGAGRIPRHGQGAPPRRHRSDPRRRLQPHRGRRTDGPTLCYRGLANDVYYILEKDRSRYADFTGCGNTLNANHPIVRRLILDSLRYWVTEMHVDGFRFDLASILSRDETGHPLPSPPILWDIESDPLLAGTKLIAEAWDAAGLYQVGSFVGDAWQEWNGRFRDDVRRFVRGDNGTVPRLARKAPWQPGHLRPQGARGRAQHQLRHLPRRLHAERPRLLRPQAQRGQRRGQSRRCQRQPELELRRRRADRRPGNRRAAQPAGEELPRARVAVGRHADAAMGDEVRRTQGGNNNAYCQDNEISWFDWNLVERHPDIHRFVSCSTAFRQRREPWPPARR